MNYRVVHRTEYRYPDRVTQCHNEAHLRPRAAFYQQCTQSVIHIDPLPSDYRERHDYFGNPVSYFAIQIPHERLEVVVTSEIQVDDASGQLAFYNGIPWEAVRDRLRVSRLAEDLVSRQYLVDSPLVRGSDDLVDYARPSFAPGRAILDAVLDLVNRIYHDFTYDPGFTTISTPMDEVLRTRRGVCQDFAHLAIGCLRAVGLAARYVSGYLETLPPPGQERLTGADASHAWFSVYVPDVGWLDFDPTNNQMPLGQHITTAWGRDFSDVTPLKGVIFGGGMGHELNVSVDVQRLDY